jgi:hypothetical protein
MLRLSIAFFFLLFISCKKDNNFSLLGKWQLVELYHGDMAWGGCACWMQPPANFQQEVEFKLDGTYIVTPSAISSSPGCTGNYDRKDNSTLTWAHCSSEIEATISYSNSLLLIEERRLAGNHMIYKYKRLR